VPFKRFLGYDRGEDGNLVINEKQVQVVRRIYGFSLQGRSLHAIAKLLTAEGIPSPGGKEVWSSSTVKSILCNEKYKGDALLQKVYTVDFLSKKKKVNEGELHGHLLQPDKMRGLRELVRGGAVQQGDGAAFRSRAVYHGAAGKAGEDRVVHFQPGKPGQSAQKI